MTGAQAAQYFNARKVGKGAWMALCPAHPDRNRSLSIKEGRKGVMLCCWSQQCPVDSICRAAGLTVESLFYDSGRKLEPQAYARVNRRRFLEEQLEVRERRMGIMDMLAAIDPGKKRYWQVAAENTEQEIIQLRLELYPGERLPIRLRGPRQKPVAQPSSLSLD